jgi:hypothetical protein
MDTLMLLRMYNRVFNAVDCCVSNVTYVWTTLRNAYTVKKHLLFDGIATPYIKSAVNIGAPSSAVPLWSYEEEGRFVEWTWAPSQTTLTPRQLPILSMNVVSDDRVIHDLTDFVDSLRVYHSNPATFPSIAHILGAWSLSSRIVLNPANKYFVTIVMANADTLALPADTHEYFHQTQST